MFSLTYEYVLWPIIILQIGFRIHWLSTIVFYNNSTEKRKGKSLFLVMRGSYVTVTRYYITCRRVINWKEIKNYFWMNKWTLLLHGSCVKSRKESVNWNTVLSDTMLFFRINQVSVVSHLKKRSVCSLGVNSLWRYLVFLSF